MQLHITIHVSVLTFNQLLYIQIMVKYFQKNSYHLTRMLTSVWTKNETETKGLS